MPHLVNLAESDLFNAFVLDNLAENTTIATPDDQDLLGIGMSVHGDMSQHFLVSNAVIQASKGSMEVLQCLVWWRSSLTNASKGW